LIGWAPQEKFEVGLLFTKTASHGGLIEARSTQGRGMMS